jgi:ribosome biogenesis GTPase
VLGGDPHRQVTAMRARELGRTPIVVGDQVDVVGDLSGRPDTLARIVRRGERRTVLRRTADDTDPTERVVVANADQLLIVVALADPPPRTGLVDRTLIAAYTGGLQPVLCLTKTDLAPAAPFAAQFADLNLTVVTAGRDEPLGEIETLLAGQVTVLLGRNGVGKTTLLKSLMGLVPIRQGQIELEGQPLHHATPYERARAGIGYVPQGREIFARLTVEENLRMGLATQPGSTPIPAELFELFPVLKQMLHRRE